MPFFPSQPVITTWTRLEPRARENDFVTSLRAEIRDPLWLLTRQRRVGEFAGADTGSPAFVRTTYQTAPFTKWGYRTAPGQPLVEQDLDQKRPLEAQALSEPHAADVATQVELGLVFFDLLDAGLDGEPLERISGKFRV